MFFSTIIFVIAFLPLFTMRGVEGAHLLADVAHLRVSRWATAISARGHAVAGVVLAIFFAKGMRTIHNPIWLGNRKHSTTDFLSEYSTGLGLR